MRVKTSVSLSQEILEDVGLCVADGERSEFVEQALRYYIDHLKRSRRDAADLEKINSSAQELNEEALDSLAFQGLP